MKWKSNWRILKMKCEGHRLHYCRVECTSSTVESTEKRYRLVEFNEAEEVLIPENNSDERQKTNKFNKNVITSDSESVVEQAIQ